jgi:FkbM family methyltransferase
MSGPRKPKGLFLNTARARCSIYESGRMAYESLLHSDRYLLDYTEVDIDSRRVSRSYDFYVFNYHKLTSMAWLDTRSVRELPGIKMTLVLEVAPNDPFAQVSPDHFDAYLVLDPTVSRVNSKVYPFPRPLEPPPLLEPIPNYPHPVLGTFGLPTSGKGFDKIVAAANREFDRATIRMNIPIGDHVSEAQKCEVEATIRSLPALAKPGIEVVITREFMDKAALIRWCSQNTLNVFLYDRSMVGLAATTDQAISSGRPLAVSANYTFRHIHSFLTPYPLRTLKQSIDCSEPEVAIMQQAWSRSAFSRTFEALLDDFPLAKRREGMGEFVLRPWFLWKSSIFRRLQQVRPMDLIPAIVPQVVRGVRWRVFKRTVPTGMNAMVPFASPLLSSFSQHGEDLWLDLVLGGKNIGFYIDVGANHPRFKSNTRRFYLRGWSGINIEPTRQGHLLFERERPRDVNLHAAIAKGEGDTTLYTLSNDTTLSTLDRDTAYEMAKRYGLDVKVCKIRTMPLTKVFQEYASDRTVDFMSVDAEGYDFEVLSTNDWSLYRPTFLLVEMNRKKDAVMQLLQRHDYALLINNQVNGLLVDALSDSPLVRRFHAKSEIGTNVSQPGRTGSETPALYPTRQKG